MQVGTLNFTLKREELPVIIDGEDYVLVELDGVERDKYLNDISGRAKFNAKGKSVGITTFTGLNAGLVATCLKKIVSGERQAVPVSTIQGWPAKVSSGLFDAAKKLSGLGEEGAVAWFVKLDPEVQNAIMEKYDTDGDEKDEAGNA